MSGRKPILPSSAVWFYPLRQLRHRPVTVLSGAAVLFCLLSMLTLSLILSESGHIAAVTESGTGTHYGVVYRLTREQYLAFLELRDTWEGEFLTVPVYARMEDVETEEGILSLAVLSEETADWYAMDTAPGTGEILLPSRIVESDSYYIPGRHGQSPDPPPPDPVCGRTHGKSGLPACHRTDGSAVPDAGGAQPDGGDGDPRHDPCRPGGCGIPDSGRGTGRSWYIDRKTEYAPAFPVHTLFPSATAYFSFATSTHPREPECSSSSAMVISMALFALPQAGNTVSNRFSDSSR